MRYQIVDGVRTQLTDSTVTEVFDDIVANFRVLTGEETLEFDTAEQVRSVLASLVGVVPVLQQHREGRWVIIGAGQLPVPAVGEVVDLTTPLRQIEPKKKIKAPVEPDEAVSIDDVDLFAEALAAPVLPAVVKSTKVKPVVAEMSLEISDSVLDLSGPQVRVLDDVLSALLEDSYCSFDAQDRTIALTLVETIVAEDGCLETVLVRALEMALFDRDAHLSPAQTEVAEEAAEALRKHIEG